MWIYIYIYIYVFCKTFMAYFPIPLKHNWCANKFHPAQSVPMFGQAQPTCGWSSHPSRCKIQWHQSCISSSFKSTQVKGNDQPSRWGPVYYIYIFVFIFTITVKTSRYIHICVYEYICIFQYIYIYISIHIQIRLHALTVPDIVVRKQWHTHSWPTSPATGDVSGHRRQ